MGRTLEELKYMSAVRCKRYRERHKNTPLFQARQAANSKRYRLKLRQRKITTQPCLYVAESKYRAGQLKIGYTGHLDNRLHSYRTTDHTIQFVLLFPSDECKSLERRCKDALLEYFDAVDRGREWFRVDDERQLFIDTVFEVVWKWG